MNYFVQWAPSAHDRLERIWMAAEDKGAVLRAANTIDDMLAQDPFRQDIIWLGEESTFIVEPLAVDFLVEQDKRKVLILTVWMIGFLDDQSS